MKTLDNVWKEVDNCNSCKSKNNSLRHILGGGKTESPEYMFVFINPTNRNITSKTGYTGPRYPFAGTKDVWKVFAEAGIFQENILEITNNQWDENSICSVLNQITSSGLYFTNIVKCTAPNGDPPSKSEVENSKALLMEEISIVKPKNILAFGLLPFKALTGRAIKLSEYFTPEKIKPVDSVDIKGEKYPVYPCYFPVGRGNPKKSAEALIRILQGSLTTASSVD